VKGAAGGLHRHEEDGEAGVEEEGGEDAAVVTSDTGRAHTRDPGAGVRAEACRDHHTADPLHEHRRADEVVEVAMAEETRRREEEEGAVEVGEGAPAMIHTTAHGHGAGAETADSTMLAAGYYNQVTWDTDAALYLYPYHFYLLSPCQAP
jgi:hypothetical protein